MCKRLVTKKLHYGKYLYKATFSNGLAFTFSSYRNRSKDKLKLARNTIKQLDTLQSLKEPLVVPIARSLRNIRQQDYEQAARILQALEQSSSWQIRTESLHLLSIYTSEQSLIDRLENSCNPREVYRPHADTEDFLLQNIGTAIVNKPSEYEYKVYLNGKSIDPRFANWLSANTDKSRVGDITLTNIKNKYYTSGNYFYIKDDRVLTMVRMIIGHNISRIEKMIYKGDIDKYMYDNQ